MSLSNNKYKVTILGAGAVGKSAITLRMVHNEFQSEYDPTIETLLSCKVNYDGALNHVDILDTAGQEQFVALQDHWIREAQGIFVVYAVNSERTFRGAADIYKKIIRIKGTQRIDLVLIGNKSDLSDDKHEVTWSAGKSMADSWKCPFLETSAKTGHNISEAFNLILRELKTDKPSTKKPQGGTSPTHIEGGGPPSNGGGGGCCVIL